MQIAFLIRQQVQIIYVFFSQAFNSIVCCSYVTYSQMTCHFVFNGVLFWEGEDKLSYSVLFCG